MLGVIIHWDHKRGLDAIGRRNLFQHYDYVCRAYAVDKLVIVDVNDTMDLSPPHPVVRTTEEALAHFEDAVPVFVHLQGKTVLGETYFRPTHVVYIVGADYERLTLPEDAPSLRIPVTDPSIELWADQALALVLCDRRLAEQRMEA
jgi:hypothetical protein